MKFAHTGGAQNLQFPSKKARFWRAFIASARGRFLEQADDLTLGVDVDCVG